MGALTNFTVQKFHYTLAEKTETSAVLEFLEHLKNELTTAQLQMRKTFVLDGHKCHKNEEVLQKLVAMNFTVLFLPPGSSWYSSIEYCWKGYKDCLAIVLAENRMANASLNADVHLRPIVKSALALWTKTRLTKETFYASTQAILDTLELED